MCVYIFIGWFLYNWYLERAEREPVLFRFRNGSDMKVNARNATVASLDTFGIHYCNCLFAQNRIK